VFTFSVFDSAVSFTDQILPIRLPKVSVDDPDVYVGSSVSIMGWGTGAKNILETADIQVYKQRFSSIYNLKEVDTKDWLQFKCSLSLIFCTH
jgi:hypothetical protein